MKFISFPQYKKHNVSNWMGEKSNENLFNGFKWRYGRKPETSGIWMWSEVFTHDFENGEKIAIILFDTQGIFDMKSTVKDNAVTFSISMMLSSNLIYNIKENIQEDDLQHLEMFSEYGRLAMEQTSEKPFQYLLFMVRDWPFAGETNYGWNGQQIVDEVLSENDDQSPDMRTLRKQIKSTFDEISGFLMPHPGFLVHDKNFNGDLQRISADSKKYMNSIHDWTFITFQTVC